MPDAYTVLWTKTHCEQIRRQKHEGISLKLLFGGPHSSEPHFSRYGVKPGDWIYSVYVSGGVLHLIGRMRVKRLMDYDAFLAENPNGLADWWDAQRPAWSYLKPTCTDEVAIGAESSPIRLDLAMSSELLERLRFRSQKAERALKYIEDGHLKSLVSLQGGVYRLSEISAQEIAALVLNNDSKIAYNRGSTITQP